MAVAAVAAMAYERMDGAICSPQLMHEYEKN
jgi:hypothetical protein